MLAVMPDAAAEQIPDPAPDLVQTLLALTQRAMDRAAEDPFGNPVLSVALAISRQLDSGDLTEAAIEALVRRLRDAAFVDRAARIGAYVGGTDVAANDAALVALARSLHRPDPKDSPVPWAQFRGSVERTRFAAVFTAHPTFALPAEVNHALADAASGRPAPEFASHRPAPMTLEQEFTEANRANAHPWLVDLLVWSAKRSPRRLQRMAGVLEETHIPTDVVTVRGVLRRLFDRR